MLLKQEFYEIIASAYRSLYDFATLRSHPVNDFLLLEQDVELKERGWRVHNLLLKFLEDLHPKDAPMFSKEWRRYRLLRLRYIETVQANQIAEELAISRRQFYREHNAAIEALAETIWQNLTIGEFEPIVAKPSYDLVQEEFSRMSQYESPSNISEVLFATLNILEKVFLANDIEVKLHLDEETSLVSVGQNSLRQLLMSALAIFLDFMKHDSLHIEGLMRDETYELRFFVNSPLVNLESIEENLSALEDLLKFVPSTLQILKNGGSAFKGLVLKLPCIIAQQILVVDDNEDTLALYQRFLSPHYYQVLSTNEVDKVVTLARQNQPDAIVLDLMMPKRDGWDLLQSLKNQAETEDIPIIICSVLKQKQLALSLGASAFLEKPFTEQSLLEVIEKIIT